MNYDEQKQIFSEYVEGTIHGVEMIERLLTTISPEDLKQFFVVLPADFDKKLGLDPELEMDEKTRKKNMQQFAAHLLNLTAALFAETFDGFVPSILLTADGKIVAVELEAGSLMKTHVITAVASGEKE